MRIAKKAAFLTAAAATAVLVGAGGAAAYGTGSGSGAAAAGLGGFSGFIFQSNDCDAATGANTQVGGAAPTGDINVTPTCTNIVSRG